MSEMSSTSDFDSEICYASDEKEMCEEYRIGRLRRNKLPRKKMNLKYDAYMMQRMNLFSNDSDTTIDTPIVSKRRTKQTKQPPITEKNFQDEKNVFAEDRSSKIKDFRFGRIRNNSKTSWTDSGVSMSKTDSQPSTLGERPLPVSKTQTRIDMEERPLKLDSARRLDVKERLPPWGLDVNESLPMSCLLERLEIKERLQFDESLQLSDTQQEEETEVIAYNQDNEVTENMQYYRELTNKDLKHRSKSVSGPVKADHSSAKARSRSESLSNHAAYGANIDAEVVDCKVIKTRKTSSGVESEADVGIFKGEVKPARVRRPGNTRHPEIIKKSGIERDWNINEPKLEEDPFSSGTSTSAEIPPWNKNIINRNSEVYNEKEREIIEQLVQNAKAEEKKNISDSSSESSSKVTNHFDAKSSKLQKFVNIFKNKGKRNSPSNHLSPVRSVNNNMQKHAESTNKNADLIYKQTPAETRKYPPMLAGSPQRHADLVSTQIPANARRYCQSLTDSPQKHVDLLCTQNHAEGRKYSQIPAGKHRKPRYSTDGSAHESCDNHFCFCETGNNDVISPYVDQLANLSRDVNSKKKNVFKRVFGFSNRNKRSGSNNERSGRNRRQSFAGLEFDRKRSGSTRSLPESLRGLWNRARSKSVENLHDVNRANLKMNFRRSSSIYSLHNYQLHNPNLSTKNSKSTEILWYPHAGIRSPVSPVRSKSLRSLSISGNYDIATHLLRSPAAEEKNNENNNLFYHPYFENHTSLGENTDPGSPALSNTSQLSTASPRITHEMNHESHYCCKSNIPYTNISSPNRTVYGQNDLGHYCTYEDHYYDSRVDPQDTAYYCEFRGPDSQCFSQVDADDVMVVAPLSVTVMHEKVAGKVQLKSKN